MAFPVDLEQSERPILDVGQVSIPSRGLQDGGMLALRLLKGDALPRANVQVVHARLPLGADQDQPALERFADNFQLFS